MVEINISVKAKETTSLQDILSHIVREITDEAYRINEAMDPCRHVDMNWVHMDNGKYTWSRNDRV